MWLLIITLWILVIQTEPAMLLLSKEVHIFVFDYKVQLKASMKYSIIFTHLFTMSSIVYSGHSNKKWCILKSMLSFSSCTQQHIIIACMTLHISLRDKGFIKHDEDEDLWSVTKMKTICFKKRMTIRDKKWHNRHMMTF
jgi:hypothetical protein